MCESLLSFLHRGKAIVWDDRIIRQIGPSRKYAGGAEGEAAGMHAHSTILTVELRLRLGTGGE